MGARNFRSKAAYLRWLKFGQAIGAFKSTPGHQKITIRGKPYKPKHEK